MLSVTKFFFDIVILLAIRQFDVQYLDLFTAIGYAFGLGPYSLLPGAESSTVQMIINT